jgi:flavin reductase (DIM6/NTAB) family NADH-FMN oxidoreductase RutF
VKTEFNKAIKETLKKLKDPGLLLVSSKKDGSNNAMAIGWGFMGVLWQKHVFVVAVRNSRFTHEIIEDTGEFTVNVPSEEMDDAVAHAGEVSGREHDKFKESNLTPISGRNVRVPVIKECKIHYECKVVYRVEIKGSPIPADVDKEFYTNTDYHTLYFGEILAIY